MKILASLTPVIKLPDVLINGKSVDALSSVSLSQQGLKRIASGTFANVYASAQAKSTVVKVYRRHDADIPKFLLAHYAKHPSKFYPVVYRTFETSGYFALQQERLTKMSMKLAKQYSSWYATVTSKDFKQCNGPGNTFESAILWLIKRGEASGFVGDLDSVTDADATAPENYFINNVLMRGNIPVVVDPLQ